MRECVDRLWKEGSLFLFSFCKCSWKTVRNVERQVETRSYLAVSASIFILSCTWSNSQVNLVTNQRMTQSCWVHLPNVSVLTLGRQRFDFHSKLFPLGWTNQRWTTSLTHISAKTRVTEGERHQSDVVSRSLIESKCGSSITSINNLTDLTTSLHFVSAEDSHSSGDMSRLSTT